MKLKAEHLRSKGHANSAVGRALGLFGIGIDTSIASAEEVGNAVKQQKEDFQL